MTTASWAPVGLVSTRARGARYWFSAALLAVSCCTSVAQAEPRLVTKGGVDYSIDAIPAWVSRSTIPEGAPGTGAAAAPIRNLLLDYQISLLGSTPQLYTHQALAAQTFGAVEKVANVPITFSPESQRLIVHALSVLRAGHHIDKLPTARVELMRREPGRESALYDGVVTADFLVDDVRVGDIVEVEYTLSSEASVGGELYNSTFPLATTEPVDTLRVRVLSAAGRPLRYSVLFADVTPRVTRRGDVSELTLERTAVPAMQVEPSTPEDAIPWPRLRVSEYVTWAQVAQWADGVYRVPEDLSPEVQRTIEDIRAQSTNDADAVRRALRFVQTEVRYTGLEIGHGAFRPTHPNQVLERRYGDCKDKALLLSAILRGLGYEARPALVSPYLGRDASEVLPMTRVFDHMLVMAVVGGKTYWLDATRTFQAGTLDRIGNPRLHWALVTGIGSRGLTAMSDGDQFRQRMEARYEITVADYREPVSIKLITTYSGMVAEMVRAMLAAGQRQQLAEQFLAEMQHWYPGVSAAGEMTVSEDIDGDVVTLTQPFSARDFFAESSGTGMGHLHAIWIAMVTNPFKMERAAPLALPYPFAVRVSYVVDFPSDVKLRTAAPIALSDANLDFALASGYENRRLRVDYTLSTRRAQVPVSDVKPYADMLRAVRERLSYQFPVTRAQAAMPALQQAIGLQARGPSSESVKQVIAALDREQEGQVRSLSEEIESGRVGSPQLSQLLERRAIAHSNLDRTEDALRDLDRAIALDPRGVSVLITRGEVYTKRGQYAQALADFASATTLDPDYEGVFNSRGYAHFLNGDFAAAQSDFRRVAERESGEHQLYALIWLYLASERMGQDGRSIIAAVRSRAKLDQWPGPIAMLFLGESSLEEMQAAAWSFDSKTDLMQRCEAHFYAAHYYLLKGDRDRARAAFNDAFGTGVKYYLEYAYARLELKRMSESLAQEQSSR